MSKREMTVEYLRGMVKKSFQNVEVDDKGKMCVLPFQSLVDTVDLYEKKIAEQQAEIERLEGALKDKIQRNEELIKDVQSLREERENMEREILGLEEEKRQLKGYIDFKTANVMCDKCKEQAVKDTAKEIYLLLENVPEDDRHYWRNAYNDRINRYKLKIKERYGVEVE